MIIDKNSTKAQKNELWRVAKEKKLDGFINECCKVFGDFNEGNIRTISLLIKRT
jgi:hypothetical protein